MATNVPVSLETPITLKVSIQGANRKFKLPLKELTADTLPDKLRFLLAIPVNQEVVFERWSDSVASFVKLDPSDPHVYKTLFRAAKAKLKLRLRATIIDDSKPEVTNDNASELTAVTPEASSSVQQPAPKRETTPRSEARERFFQDLAKLTQERSLGIRMGEAPPPSSPWSIYCNACEKPIPDVHFHCSICDNGDYDLCESCITDGVVCPGEGHWLVKRFSKNGTMVNSTTQVLASKNKKTATKEAKEIKEAKEMPGAFTEEKKPEPEAEPEVAVASRTCNSCVRVLPEGDFVTCTNCDDYDLCVPCLRTGKHGHHPGHAFAPVDATAKLGGVAQWLCSAGRSVRHQAICDGCDKTIFGVRHKCLECPDWDYCSECVKSAILIHPVHRFVPIYDPLPMPRSSAARHAGICCDGPLCQNKPHGTYIHGIRYKCAVCHDTDFCATCEASPANRHNRTHPLIMFKTPVRNVEVSTEGLDRNGTAMPAMGDRHAARRTSSIAETTSTNSATEVKTVMDIKPEPAEATVAAQDPLPPSPAQPMIPVEMPVEKSAEAKKSTKVFGKSEAVTATELNAHFVSDTMPDGSYVEPEQKFIQVWHLRNPGPHPWPAGCSVRHVGGDSMLNVDHDRSVSASELADASESNVIGEIVPVGKVVAFSILMKAPKREGKAISYWRLRTADGAPFGHRLWCDINVRKGSKTEPASSVQDKAAVDPKAPALPSHQRATWASPNAPLKTFEHHIKLLEQQNKMLRQQQLMHQIQQRNLESKQSTPTGSTVGTTPSPSQLAPSVASTPYAHNLPRLPQMNLPLLPVRPAMPPPPPPPMQGPAQARDFQMLQEQMRHFQCQRQLEQTRQMRQHVAVANAEARARDFQARQIRAHQDAIMGRIQAAQAKADEELRRAQTEIAAAAAAEEVAEKAGESPVEELQAVAEKDLQPKVEDVPEEDFNQVVKAVVEEELKRVVEEVAKVEESTAEEQDAAEQTELPGESSTMIFPTLEKESPVSSTQLPSSPVEATSSTVSVHTAPSYTVADEESDVDDLKEELESLDLAETASEHDGFLTDEEYDILDASDEEYLPK